MAAYGVRVYSCLTTAAAWNIDRETCLNFRAFFILGIKQLMALPALKSRA